MSVKLSAATEARLVRVFAPTHVDEARSLLENDCAENIPLWNARTPSGLDRLRIAAIKTSGGTIAGLVDALVLAETDWRDLLVGAGFGHDVTAHESWWPNDAQD